MFKCVSFTSLDVGATPVDVDDIVNDVGVLPVNEMTIPVENAPRYGNDIGLRNPTENEFNFNEAI